MHSYNTRFKSKNNSFNKAAVNSSSKKAYLPQKAYPPKKVYTREELLSFTIQFPIPMRNMQTTAVANNDKLLLSDTAVREFEYIKQLTKAVEECKKKGMTEEMLSNAINLMTYILYNHQCVKERNKFKMTLLNKCDEFMLTADKNTDHLSGLFTSDSSKFWLHYGLYRHLRKICNDLKTKLLSL